jgi:hypothetical protein
MHLQGFHRQTWSDEAAGQAQTMVMFDTNRSSLQGEIVGEQGLRKPVGLYTRPTKTSRHETGYLSTVHTHTE